MAFASKTARANPIGVMLRLSPLPALGGIMWIMLIRFEHAAPKG
jgi:hypothetical protein